MTTNWYEDLSDENILEWVKRFKDFLATQHDLKNQKDLQQQPEKQGHWEECEAKTGPKPDRGYVDFGAPCHDVYWFSRQRIGDHPYDPIQRFIDYDLERAFSMVGFGGIQFEESTQWFMGPMFADPIGYTNILSTEDLTSKPAVPKRVRFWVEG